MDPKHTTEIAKHLEKQNEFLTQSYKSMSEELHKLQVEEEMLMRKFYEVMSAQKKTEGQNGSSKNNEESDSLRSSDNDEP